MPVGFVSIVDMLTRDIIISNIRDYYKLMLQSKEIIDLDYYCFAASAIIKLGYDIGVLLYDETKKAIDVIYDKFYILREELEKNE